MVEFERLSAPLDALYAAGVDVDAARENPFDLGQPEPSQEAGVDAAVAWMHELRAMVRSCYGV